MTRHNEYRPRTRRFVVGAAGLAAVLGTGAYLITAQLTDGVTQVREPGAVAPLAPITAQSATASATPAATATATPTAEPATASASAPEPTKAARPSSTPTVSEKVKKEIQQARELAAKDGHAVQRGLTATGDATPTSRTEPMADGTIRITTAEGDLSGYPDRLLAADDGTRTGSSMCTHRVRFAQGAAPREIPALVLCWRTSASRSVVTVAVAKSGRPDAAASVAVIDREWARLG